MSRGGGPHACHPPPGKNDHKIFSSTLGKYILLVRQQICNGWPPKAGIGEIVKFGPPLFVDMDREKCL